MQLIAKILKIMALGERGIAALSIGGLTIVMFADVVRREVANEGIFWAQKFALHLMFWAGMLGAALVSSKGGHLRPEIGDKIWPKKYHPVLKFCEHLFIAAFCVVIGISAVKFVMQAFAQGQRNPVTDIPQWILQIVIPYTFFSMGLRHFIYSIAPDIRPVDQNEADEALAAGAEIPEGDR